MKVQFVINVPQTLALQDPSGEYNETYEEVSYPTVDGRILTLEIRAGMVSTVLISAIREGLLQLWERP